MAVDVTDIANRALQRVGARVILKTSNNTLYTDTGNNAFQARTMYDVLRRAELERNIWRFAIRRTALRALDTGTMVVVFPTWAIGTTYALNTPVLYNGVVYQSSTAANLGNQPDTSQTFWNVYLGPVTADAYDSGTTYYAGELVYGTMNTVYLSNQSSNADAPPSAKWNTLAATLTSPNIIYPLGTGPSSEASSRNIFFLPSGFMKEAPQDPTAGSVSYLGVPGNLMATDWTIENQYLVTREQDVIAFRFSGDIVDVRQFNPLFVEALGSRMAFELAEPLTQSTAKLQAIGAEYKQFMGDARMSNGIETGATQPPLDDWIATRT